MPSSAPCFALLGLLRRLQLGPVGQHRVGVLGDDVAEHVGVAAHQLGDDAARDVVDAELAPRRSAAPTGRRSAAAGRPAPRGGRRRRPPRARRRPRRSPRPGRAPASPASARDPRGSRRAPAAAASGRPACSPRRRSACPGRGVRSGRASCVVRQGVRQSRTPESVGVEGASGACYLHFRCLTKPPRRRAQPETAAATAAVTERLTLEDNRVALALFGERNANLKLIERETGAQLHSRGNELTIVGPDGRGRDRAPAWSSSCTAWRAAGRRSAPRTSGARRSRCAPTRASTCATSSTTPSWSAGRARPIAPKGLAQKRYVDAIRHARHRVRHRAGGHRQDLPGDGAGDPRADGEAGQAHRADAPRGRGGRAARLPARAAWRRRSRPTCGRSTTRSTT